jgi:hypothetical protein
MLTRREVALEVVRYAWFGIMGLETPHRSSFPVTDRDRQFHPLIKIEFENEG